MVKTKQTLSKGTKILAINRISIYIFKSSTNTWKFSGYI